MDSVVEFLYPKLIVFVLGFWSSVSIYLLPLFRYFTRFIRNGSYSKGTTNDSRIALTESMEEKQDFLEFSSKEKEETDGKKDENNPSEFSFTFKFPTFEEFNKNHQDFSQLLNLVEPSSVSEKNFSDFINSPEISSEASDIDTNSNEQNLARKDDFEDQESAHEQMIVKSSNANKIVEVEEPEEIDISSDEIVYSYSDSDNLHSPTSDLHHEDEFLLDVDFESEFYEKEQNDPTKSDFLSVNDFVAKPSNGNEKNSSNDTTNKLESLSDNGFGAKSTNTGTGNGNGKNSSNDPTNKLESLSENSFGAKSTNTGTGNGNGNGNGKSSSNDTTNKLESLWEHQELIEQLKMEIKKVKAIGLPTILEESESPPKIMEELKPWKIEEVYQNGGSKMSEVHKLYKSYRERMRKFDIFNYQKMYAIGFLQLKDPIRSSSSSASSIPEITTLLSQSFTPNKTKKHENDPTIKFIKELKSDLEVVYVGQMCLSWEILHWQYEKALDIWDTDPRGVRRFNEIASEFQQFQVLLQRFIEDEPFQGPRIQNYVKNRCVFRNLLQVPVIRDDNSKNKKARNEVVYDITSDVLVEILEESIRIFWRFVRADKYKRQTPVVDFQRPEDSQLFMDLQKDLHKKERKLKEHLRSGNCILKKLRRFREEDHDEREEDQVLYFFCQVDLKLVSRVLQMSTLTNDQLIWCHNKLSKVSFVNRKIHVEPSFLLFPC